MGLKERGESRLKSLDDASKAEIERAATRLLFERDQLRRELEEGVAWIRQFHGEIEDTDDLHLCVDSWVEITKDFLKRLDGGGGA